MSEEHLPIKESDREEMETFYNMTGDEALELWDKWRADGKYMNEDEVDPLEKWIAIQKLKQWHKQYQKGDKRVILPGVSVCMKSGLPFPRWVESAFLAICEDARRYKVKSWDIAFGKPYPKNARIESRRDWLEKKELVYARTREILTNNPETSIDTDLFEKVGEEFGICRSDANDMYYEVKNHTERLLMGKPSRISKQF